MKKNTINFWLDACMLVVMLGLALTGLIIYAILPPGSGGRGGGHQLSLWGLSRHDVGDIHFYLALTLLACLIVHLWLHWKWVYGTLKNLLGVKGQGSPHAAARLGFGLIAALLLLLFATIGGFFWAKTQVVAANRPVAAGEAAPVRAFEPLGITGQTSLADISREFGIPPARLLAEMNLPETIDPTERLGRLRRQYDFGIHEVRTVVKRLQEQEPGSEN